MHDFLNSLDSDLRKALMIQLRNLWTHSSTAIEGNTLTLGETAFILQEGLTISGKPLKDHLEVVGHARAIDLIYELVQKDRVLTRDDLFALHRAVQTEIIVDVYKPVGGWKKEPNSTVAVVDGKQMIFEYAPPESVPMLMKSWFELFRTHDKAVRIGDTEKALSAYVELHVSFVRIHPFFDGNGRLARLVANLPVLRAGLPPIIIPRKERKQYIDILSRYHLAAGRIMAGQPLLSALEKLEPLIAFCRRAWRESLFLIEEAQKKQQARLSDKGKS